MSVEHNKIAAMCLANNVRLIESSCKDLTQEQSLAPMSFDHNCVNWSLGHLLKYRKFMLKALGNESLNWSKQLEDTYDTGHEAAESTEAAAQGATLETMLATLRESHDLMEAALSIRDLAEFPGEHEFFGGKLTPAKSIIEFLLWHESTHAGEITVQAAAALQAEG